MKKVIALGFFDSLHKGHRILISQAKELANTLDAEVCVSTFDDYFFELLSNNTTKEIFTLDERRMLLHEMGVSCMRVIESSLQRFCQSGDEFFAELLCNNDIAALICGKDYTFGRDALWTVKDLEELCSKHGVMLKIAETVTCNSEKVSSRDIRKLLADGNMKEANLLLGRNYFCAGVVVRGRGAGSKFGVPTANLGILRQKLLPAYGVYKTITEVDGKYYQSLTNVGGQPTFDIDNPTIETLLLDFSGNLYGKHIVINFVRRIREIQKFTGIAALKRQIEQDKLEALND